MVKLDQSDHHWVLTLSPNRSANWAQTKLLVSIVASLVLIISIAWAFIGAWFVLPFAGIEVGLLWFISYRVSLYTYQQQVITITDASIKLQSGTYRPQKDWVFDRNYTHVALIEAQGSFDCIQMSLIDDTRRVVFGEFLNQADRIIALKYIKALPVTVLSDKWWQA
ncbi:DUF2244 domain-containing protein [Paraglaciecola sp. 20A4]|uniref:DUF2244 domain-containing protein n=1 Tax=Paraglaciecola sp. 20A4 TaxID=2687288 RepID=UPI001409571D|nr:DUF2244 domain-containing protein [Paraglaciecola sp. 20A4]